VILPLGGAVFSRKPMEFNDDAHKRRIDVAVISGNVRMRGNETKLKPIFFLNNLVILDCEPAKRPGSRDQNFHRNHFCESLARSENFGNAI
jgi:hypothetical protein